MPCFKQVLFNASKTEKKKKEFACDSKTCTFDHSAEIFEFPYAVIAKAVKKFNNRQTNAATRTLLTTTCEESYNTEVPDKKSNELRIKNKDLTD